MKISRKRFSYVCTFASFFIFLYISTVELESYLQNVNKIIINEKNINKTGTKINLNSETYASQEEAQPNKNNDVKKLRYILQWTPKRSVPFVYMGVGQQGFIEKKCPYVNCFVTDDKDYFMGDYTKFDVIVFNGPEVISKQLPSLPHKRLLNQKYVFASIESSDFYPTCSDIWNGFFNWTWTYKLDSESRWGYLVVRDIKNNIIGPKKEMHWIKLEDMDPVPDELKQSLEKKTKVAAWFVSTCVTRSRRGKFVRELQVQLKKYNLNVDIYGRCGTLKCSRTNETLCDEKIRQDYHFYLSFENAFSEDYVTEKLIHALNYDAIPIVYGGANYTRFMPDGIYLNARELGAEKLAAKMNELMLNSNKYFDYFRWKKYYRYHVKSETVETNDYCGFCAILNDSEKLKQQSIYRNFRKWWDPPGRC